LKAASSSLQAPHPDCAPRPSALNSSSFDCAIACKAFVVYSKGVESGLGSWRQAGIRESIYLQAQELGWRFLIFPATSMCLS
jgi:hypothetical protein